MNWPPFVHLQGFVAPGCEPVREEVVRNLAERGDVGAACCVYHRGVPVVDLWGGVADPATGRPWREDTLQLVFSCTKGVTAICVLLLAERGLLDLDAPVARYWPEFAAAGKDKIPVRWMLSHRAGLAAIDGSFTLEQALAWDPVVTALAAQAPAWEPGTRHGYHVRSYGWLLGELVRRVTGRSLGRFLADEVAAPLGLDLFIGLPASEEPRVSAIVPPDPPAGPMAEAMERLFAPDTLAGRAMTGPSNLFPYDDRWNRRELHAAELPSSNGITTARALARLYAATIGQVDGVRLLREDTVARACEVQSDGPDAVLYLPTRFGLGFMLPPALAPSAPPSAFGHPGAGGSLAFADPASGIAFGYVMNRMRLDPGNDRRADALVAGVYRALAA
ncbi:MAG: serine hydrolase domain-containing protein [Thermodesulfobacteriota bacterium]